MSLPRIEEIDWEMLTAAAVDALEKSYSPYSNYPVGAAALTTDGQIVTGANIENASLGITLCAECSLVSDLKMNASGQLLAFACVDKNCQPLMPCGRCRQLLFEHSVPGMLIQSVSGIRTIEDLLPDAFGPERLAS